jgi:transglycosylase-like protein with SLT domain/putative peptidoglycan binding protein/LysM domain-containing protein
MRRGGVVGIAVLAFVLVGPAWGAPRPSTAALQVALQARGLYAGPVDGIEGPLTRTGLTRFERSRGLRPDGKLDRRTRRAFGRLGSPLLGQRELLLGHVGWDVSSLEFRLRGLGLAPGRVDGRFDHATAAALRAFQRRHRLVADGIAGRRTYRALARPSHRAAALGPIHVVRPGESFFSIAERYHVSPWQLARDNGLTLDRVIVPGQRLRLPAGATTADLPEDKAAVRASLDRWSLHYGVDPKLARALAWMESGFQSHVVSSVGAIGVMQLLPETWRWVETFLIGHRVERNADGNVRIGVRYLRWQLGEFDGDVKLALAGWYQGARAVREIGLYDDTKQFVRIVLALYGKV